MKTCLFIFIIFFSCNVAPGPAKHVMAKDKIAGKDQHYFEAIQQNDKLLQEPRPGEWLYEHPEQGQSFEQYKLDNKARLSPENNILFLKPIGSFTALQLKALELTREYVEIFFQQKTILLPVIKDSMIPSTARRNRIGFQQLLSTYIIDTILTNNIPAHGFVLMALTEKDLYPQESWNFVFGQASYEGKVGVTSIYRLQNRELTETNFMLCLKRLMSAATHEIGHMFTMHHCTFAKCVMNGANSLAESDSGTNRLCSICQRKLFWNTSYNNEKRLKELLVFAKMHHLEYDLAELKLDEEKIIE